MSIPSTIPAKHRFLRVIRNEVENAQSAPNLTQQGLPVAFFRTCRKKRQDMTGSEQKPYLLTPEHAVPSADNRYSRYGRSKNRLEDYTSRQRTKTGSVMNNTLEIYNDHFGLTARPFTLLPDPDFLFWSPAHTRAYTMLEYGIMTGAPITLITGEIGSGKTTLLQHLLRNLDAHLTVGLVSNVQGSRGELLRWVLMSLDQPTTPDATYVDLFEHLQSFLIHEYARGNRVVIIFDEAQNLSVKALEELRMFTNINSNKDELLQLVLVGQPELRDMVRRPDLRQFAQRVAANFHLGPMDIDTVRDYIGHRLMTAGAAKNLFSRPACDLIYEHTGGVPRLVNQLCDLSMVYASINMTKTVTPRTVQQVIDDGAFFCAGGAAAPGQPL